MKCLECNTEFNPKSGLAKFCSASCKQKNYRKEVKRLLKIARYEDAKRNTANRSGQWVDKKDIPEPPKNSKRYFDEQAGQAKRHKLWKEGDPPEGSNAFFIRYGVFSYDEIKN